MDRFPASIRIYNDGMIKNLSFKASALIISFVLISPVFASAQTVTSDTDASSQVQSLMSQIAALEVQLRSLVSSVVGSSTMPMWNASSTPPGGGMMSAGSSGMMGGGMAATPCVAITRDLSVGSQGSDVAELQQMLSGEGFLSASSTGFFGQLTAQAVARFQTQSGIASSTGTVGPLTRNFLKNRCAGQGGMQGSSMGSSTPMQMQRSPMWQGTSTAPMPCLPAMQSNDATGSSDMANTSMMMRPCGQGGMRWDQASTTSGWMGGTGGMMGTSTPPQPCMQPGNQDSQDNSALNNAAAVAAALFTPHAMIPGMMHPCPPSLDVSGEMQQQ
jgi:hypothetical protein